MSSKTFGLEEIRSMTLNGAHQLVQRVYAQTKDPLLQYISQVLVAADGGQWDIAADQLQKAAAVAASEEEKKV